MALRRILHTGVVVSEALAVVRAIVRPRIRRSSERDHVRQDTTRHVDCTGVRLLPPGGENVVRLNGGQPCLGTIAVYTNAVSETGATSGGPSVGAAAARSGTVSTMVDQR